MKKMKTLFKRIYENGRVKGCTNEVEEGCEWVFLEKVIATEKLDGTCCMVKDQVLYKRFDYKPGRVLPKNAIPCQAGPDLITGHFPHYVKVDPNNSSDKWHVKAKEKYDTLIDGTYELIGVHFSGNPYHLDDDYLEKHGLRVINDITLSYDGIKQYLENHYIEGIVFYRNNGDMCKIKRIDFGFNWNNKK